MPLESEGNDKRYTAVYIRKLSLIFHYRFDRKIASNLLIYRPSSE